MLAREGVDPVAVAMPEVADGEHLPCPACGTAAPLVEGACSDCGLQLE
jgi:predicted nucleic acid-binding Zn ribbon protein